MTLSLSQENIKNFWKHVKKGNKPDECWNWTGCTHTQKGYGIINIQQRPYFAHRVSYQIHNSDPGKQRIFQRCNNKLCVNPSHMKVHTLAEQKLHATIHKRAWRQLQRSKQQAPKPRELPKPISKTIEHPKFGSGTIISKSEEYTVIRFGDVEKKFVTPLLNKYLHHVPA